MAKYGPDVREGVLKPNARVFVPSCKEGLALTDESIAKASAEELNRVSFNIELFEKPELFEREGARYALQLLENMKKEDLAYMMHQYINTNRELTPLAKACLNPIGRNHLWIIAFAEKMGFDFFYTPNPDCYWDITRREPLLSAWDLLEKKDINLYLLLKEKEAQSKDPRFSLPTL